MGKQIRIQRQGDCLIVELPQEYTDHFSLVEGSEASVRLTEEGILITPLELEKKIKAYQRGARKYKDAFKELAG